MRIGVAMMVRDMEIFVRAAIKSISWVDAIYLYDDNSSDKTSEVASEVAEIPIYIEISEHEDPAFYRGEAKIRNYVIDQGFKTCGVDVLIILDADEMLSKDLRPIIEDFWHTSWDAISLSMWHLFDKERYLHILETRFNGVDLIDPHTRVIRRGKYYEDIYEDGSHPALKATPNTLCLHGPYHFHLKYFHQSPFPNYALGFLPRWITEENAKDHIRKLPFKLPDNISSSLELIDLTGVKKTDTPYYRKYEGESFNEAEN